MKGRGATADLGLPGRQLLDELRVQGLRGRGGGDGVEEGNRFGRLGGTHCSREACAWV